MPAATKEMASAPAKTLIDELIDQQQNLSAVERFSRQHDTNALPRNQKLYRHLIPLTLPRPGEQYAFEVDLDACTGCKACVAACHSLNGLDDSETWRKVGVLLNRSTPEAFQRTVTTACHHCIEPGCLNGCPVEAYDKDKVTGIVRHLDDQCIGCQYCTWTCSYDVPQYSSARGIVRKCDMCAGRLAVGEAPACVQSCPNAAIAIRVIDKQASIAAAIRNEFLPDSPQPSLTIPSTRFISARPMPETLRAADHNHLVPQPAHWPLVVMLILTQAAAGVSVTKLFLPATGPIGNLLPWAIATLCVTGVISSIFHLGRPFQAWKSFLGWKHSWLSREIIAFALFIAFSSALIWLGQRENPALYHSLFDGVLAMVALAAVFCSAMVYHATGRDFWRLRSTGPRFFGTVFVLGAAAVWTLDAFVPSAGHSRDLAWTLMAATTVKLLWELSSWRYAQRLYEVQADPDHSAPLSSLERSAFLLSTTLRPVAGARFLFGIVGGLILPFFCLANGAMGVVVLLALLCCLLGEILERYLFFTAVAPPRMPGAFQ